MSKAVVHKWLVLFLTILSYFILATSQPNCLNSPSFENNSTYQANLNTLVSSLSSNTGSNGFYNASLGQGPDQINAIVLCRGDILLAACRECVDATATVLVDRCLKGKDAIFWNETCMVRYSSQPIFGKLQVDPVSAHPSNLRVPNPQKHDHELRTLLESLREHAANGGSFKKIAAGNKTLADNSVQMIFALEQCTPDLSVEDCTKCLTEAIDYFPICCGGLIGAGILRPSCTLRFENYQFYSDSMVQVPQEPSRPEKASRRMGVIVGVSVAVFMIALVSFVIIFVRWRMKHKQKEELNGPKEVSTVESLEYDFNKIKDATNDFSDDNKLGQGGFGAVYKGKLSTGQEIAVKRLSTGSGQGDFEFRNEVLLVANLQHRNLVRLLGFSQDVKEKLLVYEFMENASLDQFLFDSIKRSHLDWGRRYKIIGGIARGLLYLHEDSRNRIIHCDLKASNILLDRDMIPKIADFGMARLFGQDETQGRTRRIVGTYGYMSPEYMQGQFSIKSDVFSFGVLVLEIMSGHKNNRVQNGGTVDIFTSTWKNWVEGTPENVIDPVLRAGTGSLHDMLRCVHIGLLCVQENAADRPTMTSVALMLSSSMITLPVPSEPAFYMASRFGPEMASNANASAFEDSSRNDMTISELYPR